VGEQPIPPGVDYDLWLGPAPKRPLTRKSLHYDWHWLWEYGNGEIGNQGVHMIDICRWGLDKKLPRTAICCGGRFGPADDGEIPETQVALLDYGDDASMLIEVRCLPSPAFGDTGVKIGEVFYGSEGQLVIGHYGDATAYLGKREKPLVVGETLTKPPGKPSATDYDNGHFRNFLDAMRTRKVDSLYADVEEGHLSCCAIHLANMSYRLGSDVPFESRKEVFVDHEQASDAFGRMRDHLRDNRLRMQDATYRLGRRIEFDAATETVLGDGQANSLLSREYRKPFEVPEKVG
jgi:hypothetical protein